MLDERAALDNDKEALLTLMRTKGLSIKDLDVRKKEELRQFLDYLHNTKGMSLTDIAKLVGNKTSGYTSWLCKQLGVKVRPFEEARLKGIKDKRRKYERKPFDGTDEDKAYLLGLGHGDLSVSKPWKGVVRVSTSTTHPAMAQLFHSLFEPFGHVYQHSRYKNDTKTYEWNLIAIVDETFDFLLEEFEDAKDWLGTRQSILLSYLAGLLDAEGSIITTKDDRGLATVFVDYYNSDVILLLWVQESIEAMGYHTSLRLNKKAGTRTKKYGIVHRKDYWQLSTFGTHSIQDFLRRLEPKHPEKIRRREMALKVTIGLPYATYEEENQALRATIREEVIQFVRGAKFDYLEKHHRFVPPLGEGLSRVS